MSNTPHLVVFPQSCDKAVNWAISRLERCGFQAVRTFDLQAARAAHPEQSCPTHGSAQCNCQMIVVLVYQANTPPVTLIIHGNDRASWFDIINNPRQCMGQQLEGSIQDALNLEN